MGCPPIVITLVYNVTLPTAEPLVPTLWILLAAVNWKVPKPTLKMGCACNCDTDSIDKLITPIIRATKAFAGLVFMVRRIRRGVKESLQHTLITPTFNLIL
jgi:hypothetical protein